MDSKIAIIAGAGRFPFHIAWRAKRQGMAVVAMGIRGWADPSLASQVDRYEEIGVGQLGRLIERLKTQGIRQAIMAGKVTKAVLLDPRIVFDEEARRILGGSGEGSVAEVLGAIGRRLAVEGITLMDSSALLQDDLCPAGVVTARAPSEAERADVAVGFPAAQALARLDIGQTVVVKGGVVVAAEALEGTDAAIRRAHALAGEGLIVVKAASPAQDRRFDLPVIGTDTIATLKASGVTCLAVEAKTTLLLDRPAVVAAANTAGLCLLGVASAPPEPIA